MHRLPTATGAEPTRRVPDMRNVPGVDVPHWADDRRRDRTCDHARRRSRQTHCGSTSRCRCTCWERTTAAVRERRDDLELKRRQFAAADVDDQGPPHSAQGMAAGLSSLREAMPHRPPTPCSKTGCPNVTHEQFCSDHAKQEQRRYDRQRGSPSRRGYGSKWRCLREQILRRDVWCQWPEGCGQPATEVDHIVSRRKGGDDSASNLRGLCSRHHSSKTAREDGRWE